MSARDLERSGVKPMLDYLRHAEDLSLTDRALIEILQTDGRRPFAQIAREIGVTEKTVRRRVQHLLDEGVIHVTAVTDPVVLGYGASGNVGVRLDGTRTAVEVADELSRLAAADYVVVSTGRFPLYVEVLCRDHAALLDVVDRDIRRTPGVADVETFPYLSIYYQQAHFSHARQKGPDARGVRPAPLDLVDMRIVRELSENGRAPFQRIGAALGISESQVRQRVKRMVDAGVVQVIAIINPLGLEYRTMAWLTVRAAPGVAVAELAETFAQLRFVTYVAICTGRFDLFVEVICVSPDELMRLLDDEVRPLDGLAALEVNLYLGLHYKPLLPLIPGDAGDAGAGRPERTRRTATGTGGRPR